MDSRTARFPPSSRHGSRGTVNSDPFGPNSPQIEAGKPGNLTKPLSEMDQGIVGPLVYLRRRHSCWPLEGVNEGIAADCRTGTSNVAQGLDYLGTVKTAVAIILVLGCYQCMGKVSQSNPEKHAPPPLLMAGHIVRSISSPST
jgi:hypothetical protein